MPPDPLPLSRPAHTPRPSLSLTAAFIGHRRIHPDVPPYEEDVGTGVGAHRRKGSLPTAGPTATPPSTSPLHSSLRARELGGAAGTRRAAPASSRFRGFELQVREAHGESFSWGVGLSPFHSVPWPFHSIPHAIASAHPASSFLPLSTSTQAECDTFDAAAAAGPAPPLTCAGGIGWSSWPGRAAWWSP